MPEYDRQELDQYRDKICGNDPDLLNYWAVAEKRYFANKNTFIANEFNDILARVRT